MQQRLEDEMFSRLGASGVYNSPGRTEKERTGTGRIRVCARGIHRYPLDRSANNDSHERKQPPYADGAQTVSLCCRFVCQGQGRPRKSIWEYVTFPGE